jgi:hypothetical protein
MPEFEKFDFPEEGQEILYNVRKMRINPDTQSGSQFTWPSPAESSRKHISIISNQAGHILTSYYDFSVELLGLKK